MSDRSFRNEEPLDLGGPTARQGFLYQDHVAVSYLLLMLSDTRLQEVWCEWHDDVALVWRLQSRGEVLECVQVKGDRLEQLWTVAKLCERRSSSSSDDEAPEERKSYLQRSLQNDRFDEPVVFRFVTRLDVKKELRVLRDISVDTRAGRDESCEATKELGAALLGREEELRSPNGRCVRYWAARTCWEVYFDEDAVRNANLRALGEYCDSVTGHLSLSHDRCERVYQFLLRIAVGAATRSDGGSHAVTREELTDELERLVTAEMNRQHPARMPQIVSVTSHDQGVEMLIAPKQPGDDALDSTIRLRAQTGQTIDVTLWASEDHVAYDFIIRQFEAKVQPQLEVDGTSEDAEDDHAERTDTPLQRGREEHEDD